MSVTIREKIKGSGVWWLFVNHKGRRTSRKVGSKIETTRLADVLRGRLAAGGMGLDDLNKKEIEPFKYYIQQWFDMGCPTKKKEGLKASSIQDYKNIHRVHLEKASFYKTPVDKVTENDIEIFLTTKRRTKARSTVQHIKNLISHGFQRAMKDRVVRINPTLGASIGEPEDKKKPFEANPYNQEEIDQLLDTFKDHKHYTLVLFLCRTGCRTGECAALLWSDIDFENRKATISKGLVRGKLTTTKNNKSRKVDLSPILISALRKLKVKNQFVGDNVFQNNSGGPVNMIVFRRDVSIPMIEKAELRRTRLHDLRHSYASILISMTQDIYYAQKQLGHHSITVTVDRYTHLLNENSETRPVDIMDAPNRTLYAPKTKKHSTNNR